MTRRLPHFLTVARGDTYPARLVALDADASSRPVEGKPGLVREYLEGWRACGWDTSSRGVRRPYKGGGATADEWWEATRWALKHGGRTWIVAPCAARVWGLIGLWGLIERGSLYLVGDDQHGNGRASPASRMRPAQQSTAGGDAGREGQSHDRVHRVQRHATGDVAGRAGSGAAAHGSGGYIVLEDPPAVAAVRCPGLSGQLILVDARNYGIEAAPAGLDCAGRAAWLADVMARLVELLRANRLGSLQATAASQSVYSLRRSHMTHTMHVHTDADALSLERASYVGGRCECRRIGPVVGPVYHLDFRSLYGSIAATSALPALFDASAHVSSPQVLSLRASEPQIIAEVTVSTDEPAYPFRRDGIVIYPTGRFTTTLCGPELDDALAHGRVKHWHRWARYVGVPCLASYARSLLALLDGCRRSGDRPLCQFLKSLLVSVVGKMGQRDWRWVEAPGVAAPAPWCAWARIGTDRVCRRARAIGWQVQMEEVGEWAPNSIPSIASWICSMGRIALLQAIRVAGWSEVYYHDTDSLIVSVLGYMRLESSGIVGNGEPGTLRVLGVHRDCRISGIKSYALDGAVKCSGAPRGTVEQGPDESHYWFRRWLKGAVQMGQRPEAEKQLRTWSRSGVYRHGCVRQDGRVEPWNVVS